jgi:UDP-N-acetylmuramate--alanine ligase
VGEARGVTVMDDYAHHPTEARVSVEAARQRFPGRRLVVLFQPYSFSRTRYLLDEWKTCFADVDKLYIFQTFAGREGPEAGISGSQLSEILGPQVTYIDSFEEAAERIPGELREGDVFFTFGSGPEIDKAGRMVLERLQGG